MGEILNCIYCGSYLRTTHVDYHTENICSRCDIEKNGIREDQGTIELKKLLNKFENMSTE